MAQVSYHRTVNELADSRYWGTGPFASKAWFALLEDAGHQAVYAVARDEADSFCLPLAVSGNSLVSLTNWYAFTWRPDMHGVTSIALSTGLARALKNRACRIEFMKVPDEDGSAGLLEASFRQAGWWVDRTVHDTNHHLVLAGRSYAEYHASLPGRVRTTLKRKAGKVAVEIVHDFQPDIWDAYEQVYAQSWKAEEGDPAMLRSFAQAEGAAGRLRMGVARQGGVIVAAQFWTVERGTAYIHKLAHRDSARSLSPGTTLTAALMEQVIDRDRVSCVDFGTGDDAYKRDWMEDVRSRYRIECLDPRNPRAWPRVLRCIVRNLASRRTRR